uniref:Uncharacterized protein n=1 Tax=Oryza sativa subsp. japonica TaxID=39947 RepID=Q67IS6_ORYSJ|nr:hypothetical protein [Oryza sativa Japonica Group]BAD38615.1 hypothetical protein [Oryza sativa Japonica Group]
MAAATELSPPLQVVVALPKVTAAIIPTSSGGAPQLVDARSDLRTGDLDEAGRSGSLRGCYRARAGPMILRALSELIVMGPLNYI